MPLPVQDKTSPEYIFSKIQDFSSILRDMSLNVPSSPAVSKLLQPTPDQSLNSSLGLLPADAMSAMDASTTSLVTENYLPGNISLGQYLQPVQMSEPLSDSDSDDVPLPSMSSMSNPSSLVKDSAPPQSLLSTPPHPFLIPFPVPAATSNLAHVSSTPLNSNPKLVGTQLQRMQAAQPAVWADSSTNSVPDFEASGGFPWDKIVKGEASQDISNLQKHLSPDLSTLSDSWNQRPQDPSFCSGKFSARSTSFGGVNDTRDENFSDFATVPSFQSQGSFSSQYSNNNAEDSMFRSALPVKSASEAFPIFDGVHQTELGIEFGDQEFGSLGKEQLKCFLDQEEAECLEANPFMEEEQCEEPANSSVFSGVSDKSIMLRNSNLWGGNTSQVNLGQLRAENNLLTKVSRCEYFRHNSSRLGSLEDTVPDSDRPGLGFVHNIRSPERRPLALLSESMAPSADIQPSALSSTFSLEQEELKVCQDVVGDDGCGSSDSAPSSANSTYMHSGNSTKTVVSIMDQSGTLKASELATRLQTLADQLGSDQAQAVSVSYPDVVEDSISSNSGLEASIRESIGPGNEINLSTISKVLSEASVSSDPQHFVSVLLDCLKKREQGHDGTEDVARNGQIETRDFDEEECIYDESATAQDDPKKEDSKDGLRRLPQLPSNTPNSSNVSRCTPATLPRTRKSATPPTTNTRLSHTPTSKMTPTVSKRAMLRLTPSSAEPLSRTRPGFGHSKPIKPFSTHGPAIPSQVVSVKPQQSKPCSAPSSSRVSPTPVLSKTASLPASLDTSKRVRRPSGARHSSPIKKSVAVTSPISLVSTPVMNELSKLLDSAETPSLHLAASKHLTTSTPFHHGLNLSTVVLDHLPLNQSVSPFTNPDTSISRMNLDVSTISSAMYTSLVKPVHKIYHLSPQTKIQLPHDWTYGTVLCSHSKHTISVPINHNLSTSSSMVMKITSMWVSSCLVPIQHWDQLVDTTWENLIKLEPGRNTFDMELTVKKAGLFTFNIGVILENQVSSSGLLRIQVEEPNIQVLTDSGSKIDFGTIPENCSTKVPLVLVNCGASAVSLSLEIRQPNDLFSFAEGMKVSNFTIPGVVDVQAEGQGVAKEVELHVNTARVSCVQSRIFQTELLVKLGDIVLGSVDTMVKVGSARLRTKKSEEPVLFSCLPGESVTQSVELRNCGNISLTLDITIEEMSQGTFTCEENVKIPPESDLSFPVTFICSPSASLTTTHHSLQLSVAPNGAKHLISLQTTVLPEESFMEFKTSRPVLSFGAIKKPDSMSTAHDFNNEAIPSVFPVESDRSVINFFSIPVGTTEEQFITLRNSTSDSVCLNMIMRETDNFFLLVPAGPVSTSQLILHPQTTHEVKIMYRPARVGMDKGKLVLKPQGMKVGGKSFKASIGLCGVAGSCNVELDGVEEVEPNRYQVVCQQSSSRNIVRFMNKGESMGFVKIVCESDDPCIKLEVSPSTFLLESGFAKDVLISYSFNDEVGLTRPPVLNIFTGPEFVRQIFKKARLMSGAAKMYESPLFLGVDFTEDFPEDNLLTTRNEFIGQLTALDTKHIHEKTVKHLLCLTRPSIPAEFDQLSVEETLSETRIDQSIALPLSMSNTLMSQVFKQPSYFNPHSFLPRVSKPVPPPQLPTSPPTPDSHLLIIPSNLSLSSGGESIVKLVNKSSQPIHWDLSWPSSKLSITPGAGMLAPHGQAVLCVQALPGQASWKGQVSVYSDNSVDTMEVMITAAAVPASSISVTNNQVDMGMVLLGSTTTGSVMVTNSGQDLIQWKAQISPSFFSLPQCAGLLNPSQSISLPIVFKPAAPDSHSASLSLTATSVRGGQDSAQPSTPVLVTLTGSATMPTKLNPGDSLAKPQLKRSGGTVTLDSELVIFPDTTLGETCVSKVKIKNRSGSDQAVEILPLPSSSPFKTVHSVLEVKNQCYCTVPVQFRPVDRGEHTSMISFMWEGNMIGATLKGKAV